MKTDEKSEFPKTAELYAIRHRQSGKMLAKGGSVSLWGKIQFKETKTPKLFFSIEEAKAEREAIGLLFAGIKADDMEIVNTHNETNREKWETIE